MTFGFEKLRSKSGIPVIILVTSTADREICAPTGQLGIAFDLAIHVARECNPVTDECIIISDSLINNHDSDLPSNDSPHFFGDVE